MNLCALILAAGEGHRLRPVTASLPKALCPVGNVTLLDRTLIRLAQHGLAGPDRVAVNACYLADQIVARTGDRAHVAIEAPTPLGTAGAVGNLRDWIAGRGLLVGNADAYLAPNQLTAPDLAALLDGWSGDTVRVLCVPAGPDGDGRPAEFGSQRFAGFSLLPAPIAAGLAPHRSELVREVWRPAERDGRLELVRYDGFYLDTGTPDDFLAANLHAAAEFGPPDTRSLVAGGAEIYGPLDRAVIGAGARVFGSVTRSVVFPGGQVGPGEQLVDAIRLGADTTITVAVTAR